jgi:protocatechuate 3,4-dioxygenase beta subunit
MSSKYIVIIALFFAMFATNVVFARKDVSGSGNFKGIVCEKSKTYFDNYEPQVFNKNNNLLHSYKDIVSLCSDQIVIRGRLLDENCNPISDALVQIWQTGCDGKYPYAPVKNRINHKFINLNPSSTFIGSGTATTNNLGEFNFITMRPGQESLNYINARVVAKNFKTTQTKLFFDEMIEQKLAKKLYSADFDSDLDADENNYYFEIVIPKDVN